MLKYHAAILILMKTNRKLQKYLNNLVKKYERVMLTDDNNMAFKDRLTGFFSSIDGPILEYERDTSILGIRSKWRVSDRSPLSEGQVMMLDEGVVYFSWGPSQTGTTEVKYLRAPVGYAFMEGPGFYLALGYDRKGDFEVYHENIYLPEEIMREVA